MSQQEYERAAKEILAGIAARYIKKHEYRSVQESEFPHLDLGYYRKFRLKFEAKGFRLIGDFEDLTLRETDGNMVYPVMIRSMVSGDGSISLGLYHPKLRSLWIRLILFLMRKRIGKVADFETEFSDGRFLATSNSATAGAMSSPPQILVHFCPTGTDPLEVYSLHQARIEEYASQTGASPIIIENELMMIDMQHRIEALKAAYRGEIGGITREELDAISPGTKETNDEVWREIERQISVGRYPASAGVRQ